MSFEHELVEPPTTIPCLLVILVLVPGKHLPNARPHVMAEYLPDHATSQPLVAAKILVLLPAIPIYSNNFG